jgi:hypothetical protein
MFEVCEQLSLLLIVDDVLDRDTLNLLLLTELVLLSYITSLHRTADEHGW